MDPRKSRLLLLIENPDLGGILEVALRAYELERFTRAAPAGDAWRRRPFDLAIVDLAQGGQPAGLEVIRDWRAAGGRFSIIAISDLPQPSLSLESLDAGADDFLRKPFHHEELLGRIRSLLRRERAEPARLAGGVMLGQEPFVFGGATVTPDLLVKFPLGGQERIRPKQLGILRLFAERAGGVVLRDELVRAVWGADANNLGHSVNEYLSKLRQLFVRHRIDFNRLVVSEPKVGWRVHPTAVAGRPDLDA